MDSNLNKAFYTIESYFFDSISQGKISISPSITAYRTKISAGNFNPLFIHQCTSPIKNAFHQAKLFYGETPWITVIPENIPLYFYEKDFNNLGLKLNERSTVIYIDLIRNTLPSSEKETIKFMNLDLDQ